MERNLDRRVETLVLVRDAGIVRHVRDVIFDAYLRDTERAYILVIERTNGSSHRPGSPFSMHRSSWCSVRQRRQRRPCQLPSEAKDD